MRSGNGNDTLNGGSNNDLILGDTGNDFLRGSQGNDTLNGGSGNDTLFGDAGGDVLIGGVGSDRIAYNSPTEGTDKINNFNVSDDLIQIRGSSFGSLPIGVLTPSRFRVGSSASDANDRFIYNRSNGNLLYDSDGTGARSPIVLASLNSGLTFNNTNIVVV